MSFDQLIGQALSTELRFITVVFCDLVGSTEISSTTDAEEYSELIEAYQHRAVRIARALGGDVEGYSGDGILIRFGWPQAHDDDAAQALAASLDIVAAVEALELFAVAGRAGRGPQRSRCGGRIRRRGPSGHHGRG